jgi:hypothetical protein
VPPGMTAFRSAATGTGTLVYRRDIGDAQKSAGLDIDLADRPWRPQDDPPFSWEFVDPGIERSHPIIRLAVSGTTEITLSPVNVHEGNVDPFRPSAKDPELQIIRTQHRPSRIPALDETLGPFDIHPPASLGPAQPTVRMGKHPLTGQAVTNESTLRAKAVSVVVIPFLSSKHKPGELVRSTFLTHAGGRYGIRIYAKDPFKPARYWYLHGSEENKFEVLTLVIHDSNVFVKSIRSQSRSGGVVPKVVTHEYEVGPRDSVRIPYQDDFFEPQAAFESVIDASSRVRNQAPDGEFLRDLVNQGELLVSLVPGWGQVYDLASFAYSAVTGKRAWLGDEMSGSEQAVLGAFALVPMAPAARRVLRGSRAEFSGLAQEVMRHSATTASVEQKAAIGALEPAQQRALAEGLVGVAQHKVTPKAYARQLLRALENPGSLATPRERFAALEGAFDLRAVLDPSLATFSDKDLREAYEQTLVRLKLTAAEHTPFDWARYRSTGKHGEILRRALGTNFAGVLRFIEVGGQATRQLRTLDHATATVFTALVVPIMGYTELRALLKGHGYALEADHILEKRFFLNHPTVEGNGGAIMYDEGRAIAVPKSPEYAKALGGKVFYVHHDKTVGLRALLPHGGEHLYPPQAIWDAHVYFYTSLSIDPKMLTGLLNALEGDMGEYLKWRGRGTFEPRVDPSDRAFRPERFKNPGWWKRAGS